MSPREELEALRRLAELEAKAKAAAPNPTEGMSGAQLEEAGMGRAVANVGRNIGFYARKGIEAIAPPSKSLSDLITGKPGRSFADTLGLPTQEDLDEAARLDAPLLATSAGARGNFTGSVAATLPVGPALAAGARSGMGALGLQNPALVNALRTSGFTTGSAPAATLAGRALDMGTRVAAGGVVGGTSAAIVDPNAADTGAAIGAALPPGVKALGIAGKAVGAGARKVLPQASPEVANLAARAKELGIDIPADRLVSSKPLDAVASGLNYVPFSGRAATESKMLTQLNQAVSRTMGQDTPNINLALRKAGDKLGAEFDATLKKTGVALDKTMLDDVAAVFNKAERELGSDALKPIASQVDELIAKGASGTIEGQAAYNIKRTLDRIGRGNTPTAFHALELKRVLMDALNRSLGPEGAAAFAKTREQYGNMLALEKLAKNGVEGEISAARLGNMPNINNKPLQELADIAAQFVKAREGQHGAMQRAVAGTAGIPAALSTAGVPGLVGVAGVAGAARGVNRALQSDSLRKLMTGQPAIGSDLVAPEALYRLAPQIAANR